MHLLLYKVQHDSKEPFNNKSLLVDGMPLDCHQYRIPLMALKMADLFHYDIVIGR